MSENYLYHIENSKNVNRLAFNFRYFIYMFHLIFSIYTEM